MESGVTVKLSLAEFHVAVSTATIRMIASESLGCNSATTYQRTYLKRLEEETIGACGEIAFQKYRGKFFVPSVNTFHREADVDENIEIRGTANPKGRLIVRENDDDNKVYIFTIVYGDKVVLMGWIWGRDAKKEQFLDNPDKRREAWFVPVGKLNPMPPKYVN